MGVCVVRIGPGAGRRSAAGSPAVWNSVAAGFDRRWKGEFTVNAAAAAKGFERILVEIGFGTSLRSANFTAIEFFPLLTLLYGLYFGLAGFPAALSLCLLLLMCCFSCVSEFT